MTKAPLRKVTKVDEQEHAHQSLRGNNYTWWKTYSWTLRLECGHSLKTSDSKRADALRIRCKECLAAEVPE